VICISSSRDGMGSGYGVGGQHCNTEPDRAIQDRDKKRGRSGLPLLGWFLLIIWCIPGHFRPGSHSSPLHLQPQSLSSLLCLPQAIAVILLTPKTPHSVPTTKSYI